MSLRVRVYLNGMQDVCNSIVYVLLETYGASCKLEGEAVFNFQWRFTSSAWVGT